MRWYREPLVHFLALGLGLFLLYGAVAEPARDEAVIHLSAGEIEQAIQIFQKTFRRSPSAAELDGLIEDRIREEVYYREAVALGLDQGDTVVRRRLRQKMEFLFDDLAGSAEPTDDELTAYLAANPEVYRQPTRVSFRHIYLNQSRRGAAALDEAQRLLALLRDTESVDVDTLGDFFLSPKSFDSITENEVSKHFGAAFAERLAETPTGSWAGPVQSGYGLHLVQISERLEGELPALADVRRVVERDWILERQGQSQIAFYQSLRQRYTVSVDRPEALTQELAEISP